MLSFELLLNSITGFFMRLIIFNCPLILTGQIVLITSCGGISLSSLSASVSESREWKNSTAVSIPIAIWRLNGYKKMQNFILFHFGTGYALEVCSGISHKSVLLLRSFINHWAEHYSCFMKLILYFFSCYPLDVYSFIS